MYPRSSSPDYLPLSTNLDGMLDSDKTRFPPVYSVETLTVHEQLQSKARLSSRSLWYIIIVQAGALIAMLILLMNGLNREEDHWLYSPAQDVISYKYYRFFNGFREDISPFQAPPSAELDALWEDLYNFGISRIPKSQAARLPNRTEAIPNDEGHFIAELDVFHELHCLNRIRKALYPFHYPDMRMDDPKNEEHISHCLDSIRQSLMCSADVATIVWQWNETEHQSFPKGNVVHRCRDFDKIKDWALARRTKVKYNTSQHVESNLVIPILY